MWQTTFYLTRETRHTKEYILFMPAKSKNVFIFLYGRPAQQFYVNNKNISLGKIITLMILSMTFVILDIIKRFSCVTFVQRELTLL